MNEDIKVGDIISKMYGYSMTVYKFYRVERITGRSMFLQEIGKTIVDGDYMTPKVIPNPKELKGDVIRKSLNTYVGNKWYGKPLQEDRWD